MPGLRSSGSGPSVAFPHVGDGGGSAGWHGGAYPTHTWSVTAAFPGGQGAGPDDASTFVVYGGDILALLLSGSHLGILGDGNLMQFVGKTVESGINTGWIWNITGDGAQPGVGGGPGSGRNQGPGPAIGFPSGNAYTPTSPLMVTFSIAPVDDGKHLYMGTFWDHGTGGDLGQTMTIGAHVYVIAPGTNRPRV